MSLKASDLGMTEEEFKNIRQSCSVATVSGNLLFLSNAKLDKTKIKQQNINKNLCIIKTVLDLGGDSANKVAEKLKDKFETNGTLLGTDSEPKETDLEPNKDISEKQKIDLYNSCFLGTYQLNEIDLFGDLSEANLEQVNESYSQCLQDNSVVIKKTPREEGEDNEKKLPSVTIKPTEQPKNNTVLIGGTVGSSMISCCLFCICIIVLLIIIVNK